VSKGRWYQTKHRMVSVLEIMKPYGAYGIKRADLVKEIMTKNNCSYALANKALHSATVTYPSNLKYQQDKVLCYYE